MYSQRTSTTKHRTDRQDKISTKWRKLEDMNQGTSDHACVHCRGRPSFVLQTPNILKTKQGNDLVSGRHYSG